MAGKTGGKPDLRKVQFGAVCLAFGLDETDWARLFAGYCVIYVKKHMHASRQMSIVDCLFGGFRFKTTGPIFKITVKFEMAVKVLLVNFTIVVALLL